jgi:hypothetical protein
VLTVTNSARDECVLIRSRSAGVAGRDEAEIPENKRNMPCLPGDLQVLHACGGTGITQGSRFSTQLGTDREPGDRSQRRYAALHSGSSLQLSLSVSEGAFLLVCVAAFPLSGEGPYTSSLWEKCVISLSVLLRAWRAIDMPGFFRGLAVCICSCFLCHRRIG